MVQHKCITIRGRDSGSLTLLMLINIVTISHIIIQYVLDPVHNVTFSHQFILLCIDTNIINLVPDRYNKKWFGAKTRYFFGRKRDVLYCQNVNIWCEFETFYVSHEFNFYGLSLYVSLNFHNFI